MHSCYTPPHPFDENIFEFFQDSATFKLMNGATRFRVSGGMVYNLLINYVPFIIYLHPVRILFCSRV